MFVLKPVYENRIDRANQYLIFLLGLFIPLSVFFGNLIMALIILLWLLSGSYKNKIIKILNNKISIASIIFFISQSISILWTENLGWGFHVIGKLNDFLIFLPILLSITRQENVNFYLSGFLFSCLVNILLTIAAVKGYLPFSEIDKQNPDIFLDHITFGIPITIASISLINFALIQKKFSFKLIGFIFLFLATMSIFLIGGRTLQISLLILFFPAAFIFFGFSVKNLIKVGLIVFLISIISYNFSSNFQNRIDVFFNKINIFPELQVEDSSSTVRRLTYAVNTWIIFKENPLFGIGIGDFLEEYTKVNNSNLFPSKYNTNNPHNMYLLMLTQSGLIGFLGFIYFFYTIYSEAIRNKHQKYMQTIQLAIVYFLIIFLGDSYFLGHTSTFVFIFIVSILMSKVEKQ